MEFEQSLEEGIGQQSGGLLLAASLLLFSFGAMKQSDNLAAAREFLLQHPIYVEKLNDLKSIDRFDKITRNKVVNQWKTFVSEEGLDPKLAYGLKTLGHGELARRN